MSGQINRAAQLWQNWEEKEKMLLDIFGQGNLSENLNKQKYDFLSQGINRISKDTTPDEKLVLGLIKKATVKLEKELYPHPVVRLLQRVKNFVYDRPLRAAKEKKIKAKNLESITAAFDKVGLNPDKVNLEQRLGAESQKLKIELLSPYGTGNYTVKLNLEKDGFGHYQMSGFTALLKDPLNPEKSRSYTFPAELGINAREAVNLLQGRAVMKYEQVGANRMAGKWVQLDFNKLNPDGKPVMRETSADYEFNIQQEAKKIAIALNKPELAGLKALNGMEQGNQIVLKQLDGKTTYLEASPLSQKIIILNDKQQPITLEQLKKEKRAALKMEPAQVKTRTKKIQLNKKQQQDQSIGIL